MDIEKVARKLKPLIPKQVDHWLRARETAEPALRDLIDKQILTAARKRLGDVSSRTLLSLPPPQKIRGAIHLGTVLYEQEKWPAGISTSELLQNMAIFGRSGAGKTNVSFHLRPLPMYLRPAALGTALGTGRRDWQVSCSLGLQSLAYAGRVFWTSPLEAFIPTRWRGLRMKWPNSTSSGVWSERCPAPKRRRSG